MQLIGFQRVNEKGNRKIESDRQRERERRRRAKETARGCRELARNSLRTPLRFPLLQPHAGRRSPFALLVWSGAPSHSQTIGINPGSEGPGAQRCQTARAPSPWPVLTHATLHPLHTHRHTTSRIMQPLIRLGSVLCCTADLDVA